MNRTLAICAYSWTRFWGCYRRRSHRIRCASCDAVCTNATPRSPGPAACAIRQPPPVESLRNSGEHSQWARAREDTQTRPHLSVLARRQPAMLSGGPGGGKETLPPRRARCVLQVGQRSGRSAALMNPPRRSMLATITITIVMRGGMRRIESKKGGKSNEGTKKEKG
jgi:hypothetical protein